MSGKRERSLSGPGTIVGRSPSFAEELENRGFFVPDQEKMRNMMRATAHGLMWTASPTAILQAELQSQNPEKFKIFSVEEFAGVTPNTYGAPMPTAVKDHVDALRQAFPDAKVRIHAHPKDDPFVEFVRGCESIMTKAWRRSLDFEEIYPR